MCTFTQFMNYLMTQTPSPMVDPTPNYHGRGIRMVWRAVADVMRALEGDSRPHPTFC